MRASCVVLVLAALLSSTLAKPMAYEEHFDDLCPNGYGYGYGYGMYLVSIATCVYSPTKVTGGGFIINKY